MGVMYCKINVVNDVARREEDDLNHQPWVNESLSTDTPIEPTSEIQTKYNEIHSTQANITLAGVGLSQ